MVDWASTSPEFQALIAQHHVVLRQADPHPAPSA
jgi:hypothetical protein